MADRRDRRLAALPYRGGFGDPRPSALSGIALPPAPMPARDGLRALKAWRYVGVFGPELMLCLGSVRVGPLRQSFWAVWDRSTRRLHQRTSMGRRQVHLARGGAEVHSPGLSLELTLDETPGVETVSRSGTSYAWTRKQGGVAASGDVVIGGVRRRIRAPAVIDDTAGYYERHTSWRWCAGAGRTADGRAAAWNLVEGVHDAPAASERTLWVDGEARELAPCAFDPRLRGVGALRFEPEAARERRENLLIVRSAYRQPFGRFSGELPGGVSLEYGYGVMEAHEAWW